MINSDNQDQLFPVTNIGSRNQSPSDDTKNQITELELQVSETNANLLHAQQKIRELEKVAKK